MDIDSMSEKELFAERNRMQQAIADITVWLETNDSDEVK